MPALQQTAAAQAVDPLTAGLVLLSVTHLRRYAEGTLPANQTVIDLISKAVNPINLAMMDALWQAYL